jgi:hypothetical protein
MKEAIKIILQEMTNVTGDNPPSQKLIDAVDDLDQQMWTLRSHVDEHDIKPPNLGPIYAKCEEIRKRLAGLDALLQQKEAELKNSEERRKLSEKVYKKMKVKRFIRYVTAEVDALLAILPTSTGWTVVDLLDKVVSKAFDSLKRKDPKGVGKFLGQSDPQAQQQNESIVKQKVQKWCQQQGVDCKDKRNAEAMLLRTYYEIEVLAQKQTTFYTNKVGQLSKELKDLRDKIRRQKENLKKFLELCGKIRGFKTWKPRKKPKPGPVTAPGTTPVTGCPRIQP